MHKQTGQRCAIKIIDKKKFNAGKDALMGEVRILQQLKHPHIISINDVFETDRFLYLILELCVDMPRAPPLFRLLAYRVEGGDLFDRVVLRKMYPEKVPRLLSRIARLTFGPSLLAFCSRTSPTPSVICTGTCRWKEAAQADRLRLPPPHVRLHWHQSMPLRFLDRFSPCGRQSLSRRIILVWRLSGLASVVLGSRSASTAICTPWW